MFRRSDVPSSSFGIGISLVCINTSTHSKCVGTSLYTTAGYV